MRLKRIFFKRNTVIVARQLLGKYLARRIGGKIIRAKITETEAYCGPKDLASHASRGLTSRTKTMFGPPGYSYVYMIYGMYHCLNIVTEKEGYPAAILIRGVELASGLEIMGHGEKKTRGLLTISRSLSAKLNGPGILCRELRIDRSLNGVDMVKSKKLWVESVNRRSGKIINPAKIKKGKRIGINYAGAYKNKLWRFYLQGENS